MLNFSNAHLCSPIILGSEICTSLTFSRAVWTTQPASTILNQVLTCLSSLLLSPFFNTIASPHTLVWLRITHRANIKICMPGFQPQNIWLSKSVFPTKGILCVWFVFDAGVSNSPIFENHYTFQLYLNLVSSLITFSLNSGMKSFLLPECPHSEIPPIFQDPDPVPPLPGSPSCSSSHFFGV